jgi:phosphatidylglycerophosphatase A
MKLKLRPGRLPDGMSLGHPASLLATWFGVGLMPLASGTWGSLAALPVAWLVDLYAGRAGLLVALAVVFVAGTWASEVLVRQGKAQDPGFIVVDEVAGMFLTLAFAPPTWWGFGIAFVLFRVADIIKPFPANWCDANVHGGFGVMLDDVVAAIHAGITTWLLTEYITGDLQKFGL